MAQKDTRQCFVARDCFIRGEMFWKDTSIPAKILLEETLLTSPARGTDLGGKAAGLQYKRCYSGTTPALTKSYFIIYSVVLE